MARHVDPIDRLPELPENVEALDVDALTARLRQARRAQLLHQANYIQARNAFTQAQRVRDEAATRVKALEEFLSHRIEVEEIERLGLDPKELDIRYAPE